MSPPAVPGVPERFIREGERTTIHDRLASVEAHTGQLVNDMAQVKADVASWKSVEALVKGLVTKGILLIVGGVASAVGVTRATEPPQQPQTTIVKSSTTVKVEACTAMQPGPERDQCARQILLDLMGPQR